MLVTKLANRSSKTYKICLTFYEVVQPGTGKLPKISQGMSATKSMWYFQLAKILQYYCLLADKSRFTEILFLTFFPPCSAVLMRWENKGDTIHHWDLMTVLPRGRSQPSSLSGLQIADNNAKPLNLMS